MHLLPERFLFGEFGGCHPVSLKDGVKSYLMAPIYRLLLTRKRIFCLHIYSLWYTLNGAGARLPVYYTGSQRMMSFAPRSCDPVRHMRTIRRSALITWFAACKGVVLRRRGQLTIRMCRNLSRRTLNARTCPKQQEAFCINANDILGRWGCWLSSQILACAILGWASGCCNSRTEGKRLNIVAIFVRCQWADRLTGKKREQTNNKTKNL